MVQLHVHSWLPVGVSVGEWRGGTRWEGKGRRINHREARNNDYITHNEEYVVYVVFFFFCCVDTLWASEISIPESTINAYMLLVTVHSLWWVYKLQVIVKAFPHRISRGHSAVAQGTDLRPHPLPSHLHTVLWLCVAVVVRGGYWLSAARTLLEVVLVKTLIQIMGSQPWYLNHLCGCVYNS